MSKLYDWVYQVTAIRRPTGNVGSAPPYYQTTGQQMTFGGVAPVGVPNPQLRVQFEIKRNLGKQPNSTKVIISNLSTQTRSFLEGKPLSILFAAGYMDTGPRLVAGGDVIRAWSNLKDTDYETTIQVHDGGRASAYARTNRAYRAGTTIKQILVDAAATMGLQLPSTVLNDPAINQGIPSGLTLHGRTADVLTEVLSPLGYNWSMQNGSLCMLKIGQLLPGTSFLINQSSGMIGTPQRTTPDKPKKQSEILITTLLWPELYPGAQITLQSSVESGSFRIKELTHKGDSYGDDWSTEIRCI